MLIIKILLENRENESNELLNVFNAFKEKYTHLCDRISKEAHKSNV